MCHLGTGQSIICQLCSESSALQKVVHDWHNQKHGDSQTQKSVAAGGFSLSAAGRCQTAHVSRRTGSEVVRYWICKHDIGKQRPF